MIPGLAGRFLKLPDSGDHRADVLALFKPYQMAVLGSHGQCGVHFVTVFESCPEAILSRDHGDDHQQFNRGKVNSDTNPRAAAKRNVSTRRTRILLMVGLKTFGIEAIRISPEARMAME